MENEWSGYLVSEPFPTGQKIVRIVLEREKELKREKFDVSSLEVENCEITGVRVEETEDGISGVILDVEAKGALLEIRGMEGKGADTRTKVKRPVAAVKIGGVRMQISRIRHEIVDEFIQRTFVTREGNLLNYNLYIPRMQKDAKYPLLLFMHDSAACSDDVRGPLIQGTGATSWADETWQKENPCFVLAPQYPEKTADDEGNVTWELEATVELIHALCAEYAVDPDRVYGTGQSMGCMMLCEMNYRCPELFAANFMVAGQWEPEKMKHLWNKNIWILISEKDEKAFPVMSESVARMEQAGAKAVRAFWDAGEKQKTKESIDVIGRQNASLVFTCYTGDSVLLPSAPAFPGAHHIFTWCRAYEEDGIKKWLFSKRLKEEA